jgi:hypothetical protein
MLGQKRGEGPLRKGEGQKRGEGPLRKMPRERGATVKRREGEKMREKMREETKRIFLAIALPLFNVRLRLGAEALQYRAL